MYVIAKVPLHAIFNIGHKATPYDNKTPCRLREMYALASPVDLDSGLLAATLVVCKSWKVMMDQQSWSQRRLNFVSLELMVIKVAL